MSNLVTVHEMREWWRKREPDQNDRQYELTISKWERAVYEQEKKAERNARARAKRNSSK